MTMTLDQASGLWLFEGPEVPVADAPWTTVLRIPLHKVDGDAIVNLEVESDGTSAASLDAFQVLLKDHPAGQEYAYILTADWASSVISNLRFTFSVVPNTLAAGAFSHVTFRCNAAYEAIIQAAGAGNTAKITCRGSAKRGRW